MFQDDLFVCFWIHKQICTGKIHSFLTTNSAFFSFIFMVLSDIAHEHIIILSSWCGPILHSITHFIYCRNVATINSLEEFLDSIHTQLDELWRLPQNYPQNRMIDLMDIICRFLLKIDVKIRWPEELIQNWLYGHADERCACARSIPYILSDTFGHIWSKRFHTVAILTLFTIYRSFWCYFLHFLSLSLSLVCTSSICYFDSSFLFLLGTVALNVTEFCSDRLNEIDDVWDVKSLRVFQTLNDITEVIESWIQVCDSLTRLFWPNYARHAWIGVPHIPKTATLYLKRLHAIQAIRNVYKEIVSLFNEINQIDKSVRRIFIPFRGW